MPVLSREAILAKTDMPTQTVACPEWGGDVVVSGMTKAAQLALTKECSPMTWDPEQGKQVPKLDAERFEVALFVASCAEPKFSMDDIPALRELAAGPINRVNKASMQLNGMTGDGKPAQEAADAATKSLPS